VTHILGTKRWLAVVLAGSLALLATRAAMAADPRELKAREAFAAQRYQEALDLFAKLYAETLHPIYLRNIGRCYQNMDDPDRAISSFHEYLRKAKNPTADETREVEGFIKEMEELKRRKDANAASATAKDDTSDAPVKPLPSASPPPAGASASASVVMTPPPPAAEESPPVYTRWWFWTIIGGAVAAGLGIAFATGAFTQTKDASCPMGTTCGINP
jgi:tetratricopeptide (TPR) repeat protein